ncbi:hypothetical protein [Halorussus halobius]|uniref:hypothetical protein n=1 Tax=Halorussus halobius TaxID=1710537 RepID=UPI001091AC0E|nr:hypothetical protein [Halorussus halobius]
MSNAPSTFDATHATGTADESTTALPSLARAAGEAARERVQFTGFWSAVLLPLVYVPMLVGGAAASRPSAVVALLGAHALALVAGHGYHEE